MPWLALFFGFFIFADTICICSVKGKAVVTGKLGNWKVRRKIQTGR